jgi:hypothetical protein
MMKRRTQLPADWPADRGGHTVMVAFLSFMCADGTKLQRAAQISPSSLSPSLFAQHKERNGAAMSQFTAHEISSCCLCAAAGLGCLPAEIKADI